MYSAVLFVFAAASRIDARLSIRPSDAIVFVGDRVVLSCATDLPNNKSVQWNWIPTELSNTRRPMTLFGKRRKTKHADSRCQFVVGNETEQLGNGMPGRSPSTRLDLVIHPVAAADAGRYVCRYDDGYSDDEFTTTELVVVVDRSPTCYKRDACDTGLNNITYVDMVSFVCRFRYAGHIPPIIEWISQDSNSSVPCTSDVYTKATDEVWVYHIENCITVRRPINVSRQYNYTVSFVQNGSKLSSSSTTALRRHDSNRDADAKVIMFATSVTVDPRQTGPANGSDSESRRNATNRDDVSIRSLTAMLVVIMAFGFITSVITVTLIIWFTRRRKVSSKRTAGLSSGPYQGLKHVAINSKQKLSRSVASAIDDLPDRLFADPESREISNISAYDEVYDTISENYETINDN
jgi:hypothetical protein